MSRTIVVPRGEHSPLGPSASKRWLNCAGSLKASFGAKDDESEYAAEGTAAHYLSELARRHGKPTSEWLGDTFSVGKYQFVVNEEMIEATQEFCDWCAEQPGIALVEQRVDFSGFFHASTVKEFGFAFGTLDDARLSEGTVTITDFKYGRGVQEFAEENPQLKLQALGVFSAYSYLYDIRKFRLQICQPRLDHADSWEVGKDELLLWGSTLKVYGRACEEGTRFAAGDWCKFCKIRKTCEVRANSNIQLMLNANEFDNLDERDLAEKAEAARSYLLTPERLEAILPALSSFEAWVKDVKKHAVALLIGGTKIGDWKIVAGRSARKWRDEALVALSIEGAGVDPYDKKLKSVAAVEKEMGKKGFAAALSEIVVKAQGKPTLAPGDDRREAITTTAMNEFSDLDVE